MTGAKWFRDKDGGFSKEKDGKAEPIRQAYLDGYEKGFREGQKSGYDQGYSDSAYFFRSYSPEELELENDEN